MIWSSVRDCDYGLRNPPHGSAKFAEGLVQNAPGLLAERCRHCADFPEFDRPRFAALVELVGQALNDGGGQSSMVGYLRLSIHTQSTQNCIALEPCEYRRKRG